LYAFLKKIKPKIAFDFLCALHRCCKRRGSVNFPTMYRVQYKNPKEWVFVCEDCLLKVKENNSDYKYGGTWKK